MASSTSKTLSFAERVLKWFDSHGRKKLPWQEDRTPYRVWISEIMLQQTQVNTVIPYYLRFMERYPTVQHLAEAETDHVLHLWTGLGYYARARNLHTASKTIAASHQGELPNSVEQLMELEGIGQSTAGAIAALSMNIRAPILDGNVKRVLTRFHAIEGWPEQNKIKSKLWEIAERLTPTARVDDYTQAMMDLGSMVCTRSKPLCKDCPLSSKCESLKLELTHSIPGKKPKKTLPIKSVAMFILQNEKGEVLLEKRPPSGIWGSLFSLPEAADVDQMPELGNIVIDEEAFEAKEVLESIRHTFSHYHLDINPISLRNYRKADEVAESDSWLWYPLDHSVEVGLAAPVKKLLNKLAKQQN